MPDVQARIGKAPKTVRAARSAKESLEDIRFLTWDDVERLAAYLDPHVHRIVPLAALTAMRRGELFALTDRQVDLDVGAITLRITKTRKPRKVWLCAEAKQVVREQLLARTPNSDGYVFTTRRGSRLWHPIREVTPGRRGGRRS
ncbi:MAG TPA: tyrosine-type recombinase/integrase [Gaiellaceae bacterium]|nr:tyrosine-type recombinase/integrase [Gaiellaceae bacterium]